MKNLKLIGGVFLIVLALATAFTALVSPDNRLFVALWDMGLATFRGDGSLGIIYGISIFFLVCGILLLNKHKTANRRAAL